VCSERRNGGSSSGNSSIESFRQAHVGSQLAYFVLQPPLGMLPAGVPERAVSIACTMQHSRANIYSSGNCSQWQGCPRSSSSRQPAAVAGTAAGRLSGLHGHTSTACLIQTFVRHPSGLQGFCHRVEKLLALVSVQRAQVNTSFICRACKPLGWLPL
jgi:hypothetical protein